MTLLFLFISLIGIALSLVYFVRLHLTLRANKSIYNITKNSNGEWNLILKKCAVSNVLVSTTSFVSNSLIILIFVDASNKHYTALITPDSTNEDIFRRLKVNIKTSK